MTSKNRIVDALVTLGSLARKVAHLVYGGMGLKGTLSPPSILAIDADSTSTAPLAANGEDGQIRSITLPEYSAEELATIYESKTNLLPSAPIVAEAGSGSTRFGVSGAPKRGDAAYTVGHDVIRRGMVETFRPLRERSTVATRGLAKDSVSTSDRTVNIYTVLNGPGGFGNGTLVPSGIDAQELGRQQGLERLRNHPYMIFPSSGNGANYQTAAAAAVYSFRQMMAGCLTPSIIRDEKLGGTRTPTSPIFHEPTVICPTNGRVTFTNRDEAAGLVALDILLRGDARFSTDAFFTDFASRVHGGHIGREMVCRAVGHSVIEFNPQRADDALDARLTEEVAQRLLTGTNQHDTIEMPVCALPEVAGLLESAQRPTGTDVATDTYAALADAPHETIQATVQDAHAQLQQRADDYGQRLDTLSADFTKAYTTKQVQQVQRAIGTLGLPATVKRLASAKERQAKVAAEYIERYAASAGPDASAYQAIITQIQEHSQAASRNAVLNTALFAAMLILGISCMGTGLTMFFGIVGAMLGWTMMSAGVVLGGAAVAIRALASHRSVKRTTQLAIEATNLDLALFDHRVTNIRLMAGRNAVSALVETLERLHAVLNGVTTKTEELSSTAASRFAGMAEGSVPLEVPGIVLPTNSDVDMLVTEMFAPKLDGIIGPIIPTCIVGVAAMLGQFQKGIRAEIDALKLSEVTLIDFVEKWPNAIHLEGFATERINESWPMAPIDPTAEPGYTPPTLRVVRSNGGNRNAGPLVERLRKGMVEEVSQVRDQDFGDPRRIIISHERRRISYRQISYLTVLEREAQPVMTELEPFLVTAVADPRALDAFRCGGARDEGGAWGSFFRAVAQKIIARAGDNTYLVRDAAMRGMLQMTDDEGRLAQGLPNMISRLTADPTLRRTLDEMFLAELQRDGKKVVAQGFLAAMHLAGEYVPANAVSKFREVGLREVCKLMPECRTADDAARLVSFTPPAPTARKRNRAAAEEPAMPEDLPTPRTRRDGDGDAHAGHASQNGNGNGRRDLDLPTLRR
jgi:hypothetical protein